MLPAGLRPLLLRAGSALSALGGSGERAAAQRMAMISFAIRIGSAALAFLSQIFFARMMGEHEYGIFVFVWVLIVLFGEFACFGFHTAIIRFLPHYKAAGAMAEIRGLTGFPRIFALTSGTLILLVGLTTLLIFSDRLPSYYLLPVALGLVALPMIALGSILEATSRANHWSLMALGPVFIIRPLLLMAVMAVFVWRGAPASAVTAMVAALAATYVTVLGHYIATRVRLSRHYPSGAQAIEFRRWLAVAVPVFLVDGAGYLLTSSDVVMVGIFLPPQQVGVYFAAAKTMALVHFIMFSVKVASGPRFSGLVATGSPGALGAAACDAARWTFWPALCLGLALLVAGKPLLSLFGAGFTQGYLLMAILLLGILAKALVGPAETLLTMSGRQMLCVWLYLGALAANLVLNLTLIPLFGVTGTALATASAMAVEAALLAFACRRALGITVFAFARPSATPSDRKD